MDVNEDGRVGLREVLVGLALLGDKDSEDLRGGGTGSEATAPHVNFLNLAFALLDPGEEGAVQRSELEGVIHMVWPHLSTQRLHEISGEAAAGGGDTISRESFMAWCAKPAVMEALKLACAQITPLA